MFKKNFISLCNEKGVAPTQVLKSIGLDTSTFSRWDEKSLPRATTLQKIANYFNVTVEYLKGEEKEKPSDEPKAAVIPFNENEEKLLECFRACDLEGQIKILNTAIEQRDTREKITRSKTTTNA